MSTPVEKCSYYRASTPTCPHCGYAMNYDDMHALHAEDYEADIWILPTKEERTVVACPICDKEYWVQGGYAPQYTSAFSEEDL